MAKAIGDYTDPKQLRQIMKNAKAKGNEEVWSAALEQICKLEGNRYSAPLEADFHTVLAAYEELLTERNGRTTKASRTRQKINRVGVIQCLEDWAVSDATTQAFDILMENDLHEYTGEYLVLKYPDLFSVAALEKAKERLEQYGFSGAAQ